MVTFNINLFSIKKSYFWFNRLSSVAMATSLSGGARDFLKLSFHMLPWIRVTVEKPMAGPGETKKWGRGGDSGDRGPAFQAPHQSESTSRIWMLDFIGSYLTGLER